MLYISLPLESLIFTDRTLINVLIDKKNRLAFPTSAFVRNLNFILIRCRQCFDLKHQTFLSFGLILEQYVDVNDYVCKSTLTVGNICIFKLSLRFAFY